jgi:hypothetical protein
MGKYQLTLALLKPDIALNEQAIDVIIYNYELII